MIHRKIDLTEDGRVYLLTYVHQRSAELYDNAGSWQPDLRPAVLILPGGAYMFCSDREGEPVAMPFLAAGFNAFVLYYSVGEYSKFPAPLDDVSRAIWEIRKHSKEWYTDPDKIAVGGFSAGGNLAAMIGTQWNTKGLAERLGIPEGGNKPNAIFPCYALTGTDRGMMKMSNLEDIPLGAIFAENAKELNVYKYVGTHTPPAFIWHTFEDDLLDVNNALKLAEAYNQHNIPFELHIYQFGRHGTSINTDLTAYRRPQPVNVASWVPLCINWLKALFDF
jgi:acetyl esterase/lipase